MCQLAVMKIVFVCESKMLICKDFFLPVVMTYYFVSKKTLLWSTGSCCSYVEYIRLVVLANYIRTVTHRSNETKVRVIKQKHLLYHSTIHLLNKLFCNYPLTHHKSTTYTINFNAILRFTVFQSTFLVYSSQY